MENQGQAPAPVQDTAPVQETQDTSNAPEEQAAEGTQEATTAEKANAAAQKELKKQLKQLKIKYNGKEEEVSFDPNDDAYLARQIQMAKGYTTKAEEFNNLQKQVGSFIEELRKNPRKVLNDPALGVDFKKIVNDFINEEIENSKKSPEQLEKERLENELRRLQEERKKDQEEAQKREFQRLQEDAFNRYDQQITEAISSSDLPKSPYVVKKMADYMLTGLQNGVNLEPADILPLVREEIQNDIKEMFSVMPEEVVEGMLGKEFINKARKKSVAKVKSAATEKKAIDVGTTAKKEQPSKKVSYREFFKLK